MKSSFLKSVLPIAVGIAAVLGVMSHGITKEVPLGGIVGIVTMKENGRALPHAFVELRPIFLYAPMLDDKMQSPQGGTQNWNETDERRDHLRFEADQKGHYSLRDVQAGDYEISVTTAAHRMESQYIHIDEGKPQNFDIELEPVNDYLNLICNQHAYMPSESVEFYLAGFGKTDKAKISVYRLDKNKVLAAESIAGALSPISSSTYRDRTEEPSSQGELVTKLEPGIESRDFEGIFNEAIKLPSLKQGTYLVQCKYGDLERSTWISVTDLALVSKEANGDLQIFATNLKSGAPVSNVSIGYALNGKFRKVASTDSSGIAKFHVDANVKKNGVLMGQSSDSIAFVNLQVSKPATTETVGFIYTDRPIYRPGDTVSFKGIFRELDKSAYRLTTKTTAQIEIRDADDTLIDKRTLPISNKGVIFGKVDIYKESNPGEFRIRAFVGDDEFSHSFSVAAYRKPEFSIKVEPATKFVLRGDTAEVVVQCEYFFGGPVQNAEVTATIYRSPIWSYGPSAEDEEGSENYDGGGYGGEYFTEVEAKTDSSGRAILRFPTVQIEEQNAEPRSNDENFQVAVSVTDGSGKYFDGEGSVRVIRSLSAARIQTDAYVVKAGDPFDFSIQSYSSIDDKTKGGQKVEVEAGYNVWEGKKSNFRAFSRQTVTTDNDGKWVFSVTPNRGGQLELRCKVTDENGRKSFDSTYVWVDKLGDIYGDNSASEAEWSIKLDKRSYKAGDKAKLVIQSASPGESAWVTVEADKIYHSEVVKLEPSVTVIELPVKAEYLPSAYVHVTFVKDKKLFFRERRLTVDLGAKALNVKIQSDKPTYNPGETATYSIQTKDEKGNPMPSEVSFGLVDESIYAIQKDGTNIESAFYPIRYNEVRTGYSFEEIYLDGGDKAPKNIEIRRRFKDTADWQPSIQTDAQGRAQLSVKLPDNLTSWRATVVAISDDTSVGQTTLNVKARKQLMVRLEAPAYFVETDKQRLAALVTNDSGKDADVNLEISAISLKMNGELKQKRRIANGATETFEWEVEANVTGEAVVTAKTWIDANINDGVELRIPVQPHGRLYTESTAGTIGKETRLKFVVRDNADQNSGRLRLTITPTLAGNLVSSLDELIDYPYGCVEQTMSRFLPTVIVSQAVSKAGLPWPKRSAEIPEMVAEGLARLKKMQHADGGWGWWEYDDTDEFMTGYVLEGLAIAKDSGFEVNQYMIDNALKYCEDQLKEHVSVRWEAKIKDLQSETLRYTAQIRKEAIAARIQHVYGLVRFGKLKGKTDAFDGLEPEDDQIGAIATLALAHNLRGDKVSAQLWFSRLKSLANESQGLVYWNENYGVEETARAMLAYLRFTPDDPAISKISRYLLTKKRGDSWWSTRDTSAALIALTGYLERTREIGTTGQMTVSVNGESVKTFDFNPATVFEPDQWIEVPISKLKPGSNEITLTSSSGTGYYATDLRQYVRQESLGALLLKDDLKVERKYYKLGTTKLENGQLTLMPGETAINDAEAGQMVKVVLTIETKSYRQFVMVEDPIPSNCRINDRGDPGSFDDWGWWWAQTVVRDDRAAFFITSLPPGIHRLTYVMRAENPGIGHAMPTVVSNMYDPDSRASSAETFLKVEKK